MKRLSVILVVMLLVFCIEEFAIAAFVMDFDDLEEAGSGAGTVSAYSDGLFEFLSSYTGPNDPWAYWQQSSPEYNTSAALFSNYLEWITLKTIDDRNFELISMDVDMLWETPPHSTPPPGGQTVTFYGYNQSDVLVGTQDVTLTSNGWKNVTFGSDFDTVAYVKWLQGPGTHTYNCHHFDNVTVEAVPIPTAVWLLGSGLVGLVGFRRRKYSR